MPDFRDELLVHVLGNKVHLYTTNKIHIQWLVEKANELGFPVKGTESEFPNWITLGDFESPAASKEASLKFVEELLKDGWAFLESVKYKDAHWYKRPIAEEKTANGVTDGENV